MRLSINIFILIFIFLYSYIHQLGIIPWSGTSTVGEATTTFHGSVYLTSDSYGQEKTTFYVNDSITVQFNVVPAVSNQGQSVPIYVYRTYNDQWQMKNEQSHWLPFEKDIQPLVKSEMRFLGDKEVITVLSDFSGLAGKFSFYVGYGLPSGRIVSNSQALEFEVLKDTIPPVITVTGDNTVEVYQNSSYTDAGATANDDVDSTVNVSISGSVDTSKVGIYTISYTATDKVGNQATAIRTVNVLSSPGVNVSSVRGNTASYNSIAEFDVSLKSKPLNDVVIPVVSSNENEGIPTVTSLTFTPDNWNQSQTVVVKGRNKNVANGIQDYKIILGTAQSGDSNYNGFDPDDVEIKGIVLSLSEPTNSTTNLIPGLSASINANITYTGNENLSYTLVENPDGMTIDLNSGLISSTLPESAGGNNYPVKVKVTDGILFSKIAFSVSVASITPLQTNTEGNTVTVTEEDSNLKGLSVNIIDSGLNSSEIVLNKLQDSSMLTIPDYTSRISDFFIVKDPIDGKLKVKLPLSQLPEGTDLQQVKLYNLTEADGIEGQFWSPVGIDIDIYEVSGESIVEITLEGLEGAFFVGIETSSNAATQVRENDLMMSKFSLRAQTSDVTCTPETKSNSSVYYNKQTCTISSNNNIKITVLGFGSSASATRWQGTTIQELIIWLIDAQKGFKDLDLDYDNEFTVSIHSMPVSKKKPSMVTLGYVTTGKNEKRKTLHLTSANEMKKLMQATAVHEYFHHAQSRSKIANRNLLIDGDDEKKWFIEGTAQWFEDYLFDSLDSYILTELHGINILEKGLISEHDRPYQRFSFFKLLSSKCKGFNGIFKELLNIDRSKDPSGIENLKTELGNANCNFGNHIGVDKLYSIEAALLYYQYATLYKNKISLLDSNENDNAFKFKPITKYYEKSDWSDVGEVKSIKLNQITKIPAYGAYSIKVKGDMWNDIQEGKEAVLRVKVGAGASPLTVSLLSEDSTFTGNTQLDGIQHKHYKTNEISEYIFSQDELVSFFITVLNPNSTNVAVSEITFEIREKLSPELEIISPTDASNVNNRVISVTGKVPDTAANVDRVVVTNGSIKTVTIVAGDKSFSADIVVAMGSNALILQGYNSSNLTKPLTKEKIVNVTGIENTSGDRNALVASSIALVLRWKTNGTDIDIYSTDKNNGTIWYSNLSVSPGFLDYDNTSGYGPEVISYRKTDDAVYINGKFDVDIHFFSGSTPTDYSLDVIMNETDSDNLKARHYESIQSLPSGNSSENSPAGSGNSRFNDVLSINCNAQRICLIGAVDTSKLSNTTTVTEASASR